jgi:hypothetical protein
MYELIKSKTERVSPRRAADFLKQNTFMGQRNASQDWVQNLATKMKTGVFTKGAIAFAQNGDGIDVMMNGQHQCEASVQSGESFTATIDYYKAHEVSDMWHLFATFDAHRARTEGNVMKAARGLFESDALKSLPLRLLTNCGSALVWLGGGTTPNFHSRVVTKADKADLVEKYENDVLTVASYQEPQIPVAAVCAIIATHRANDQKAREFWERVIVGDQLVKNTPQWSLHKGMREFTGFNGGAGRNLMLYRLCIMWWNAFVTGEQRIQAKYKSMKGIPEVKSGKKGG